MVPGASRETILNTPGTCGERGGGYSGWIVKIPRVLLSVSRRIVCISRCGGYSVAFSVMTTCTRCLVSRVSGPFLHDVKDSRTGSLLRLALAPRNLTFS